MTKPKFYFHFILYRNRSYFSNQVKI